MHDIQNDPFVKGSKTWMEETKLCILGNKEEEEYLLRQSELAIKRVHLLREINSHLTNVLEKKQKELSEYIQANQ
jgi:hypothetical protein